MLTPEPLTTIHTSFDALKLAKSYTPISCSNVWCMHHAVHPNVCVCVSTTVQCNVKFQKVWLVSVRSDQGRKAGRMENERTDGTVQHRHVTGTWTVFVQPHHRWLLLCVCVRLHYEHVPCARSMLHCIALISGWISHSEAGMEGAVLHCTASSLHCTHTHRHVSIASVYECEG